MKDCPNCSSNSWKPFLGQERKFQCRSCENVFPRKELHIKKSGRSHARGAARKRIRRSRKNENRRALALGGEVTPGSGNRGALSVAADVVVKSVLREEDKETEAKSYTLHLADLLKIERQALANNETPAFRISFLRHRQSNDYVVLREEDFDQLFELLRRHLAEGTHTG